MENLQNQLTLEPFADKLKMILDKNPGFWKLHKVSNVLRGSMEDFEGEDPNLPAMLSNAPIVTCDAERSFSFLRVVNQPNRRKLTEDILMLQWINNL